MTNRRPEDLFTAHPATTHNRLIVRYPDANDGRLGYCFADAAERLAATYAGAASDDALLLPFLYLYRHAIELELKHSIRYACALRLAEGHDDPDLEVGAVAERLQKRHSHRIGPLLVELDRHMGELGIPQSPKEVRRTLALLANTDPAGESFRYAGRFPSSVPNAQDYVDFVGLQETLRKAHGLVRATTDVLSQVEDAQELAREMVAEYQSEISQEFEAEMRREHDYDSDYM